MTNAVPDVLIWGFSILVLGGSLVVTVIALIRSWRRGDDD